MSSALPKLGTGCVASRDAGDFKILGFLCMVSGSAPALGSRRVRLAPDMSKIPPACSRIFFQLSPRGRVLVPPRAGALPETMALSRYWRGGMTQASVVRLWSAAASRVDFIAELGTSFDGGLCSLAGCGGMFIFLIDTTHLDI